MLVRSSCLLAFLAHQAVAGGEPEGPKQQEPVRKDSAGKIYDPNPHIIEGTEAAIGQYPYYVHMQIQVGFLQYSCGGSLIAPQVILSAAHCNDPYDDANVERGYVGATRFWSTDNGAVLGDCQEWRNHPEFVPGEFDFFGNIIPGTTVLGGNDFALCLLEEPVYIDRSSVILRMNDDPDFPPDSTDTVVETLGMGQTSGDRTEGTDVLLRADINIFPQETCQNTPIYEPVDDTMICTFDNMDDTMSGVCSGDSGGPIVYSSEEDGKTIHTQVGVVSWGVGNCGTNPDVHARVSAGMSWIKNTVCNDWGQENVDFCGPPRCPNGESVFTVKITTDDTPEENMWVLRDSSGMEVASEGLEEPNREYADTICLLPGSYEFELTDSGNNGMPDGSVEVSLNNEVLVDEFASGTDIILTIIAPDDLTNNPTAAPTPTRSEAPTMAPTEFDCDTDVLVVSVETDNFPFENSWTLEQYDQDTSEWTEIASSPPFLDAGTLYVNNVCLDPTSVFRFTIIDTYGDGLCFLGNCGFYNLDLNGVSIASGDAFGSQDVVNFNTCIDSEGTFEINTGDSLSCDEFADISLNRNRLGSIVCKKRNVDVSPNPGRNVQRVFDFCPETCGTFGFGVCAAP